MISGNLEVIFACLPDRDYLAAELRQGVEQIAEVNSEAGSLELQVYSRRDGREWIISLIDFEAAMAYVRTRLPPDDPNSS